VEYLGHMIYLSGLGVKKVKVEAILQLPQPLDLVDCELSSACVISIGCLVKDLIALLKF